MWDPLAQLVEHNTFNVGVLGSSPKRITTRESLQGLPFLFAPKSHTDEAAAMPFTKAHTAAWGQKKRVATFVTTLFRSG